VNLETLLPLLLGAGGTGFIAGAVKLFEGMKKGKIENEATLLARLNAESVRQATRADAAEAETLAMRRARDRALEMAMRYRGRIIECGGRVDDLPSIETLYEGAAAG
jgi:hypothetical protein